MKMSTKKAKKVSLLANDEGYDFSKGRRGAVFPVKGKTRITILIDDDILAKFRSDAEKAGGGYQTRINAALRDSAFGNQMAAEIRSVVRSEVRKMLSAKKEANAGPRRRSA